jgi:hypothetical protein
MKENMLVFRTRCTKVTINYDECEPAIKKTIMPECGFSCVKADRIYDRNILKIEGYKPVLAKKPEDVEKSSNESLSWEFACKAEGKNAINIEVDYPGLEDLRKRNNKI